MTHSINRSRSIVITLATVLLSLSVAAPSLAQITNGGGTMPYRDPRSSQGIGGPPNPNGSPNRDQVRYRENLDIRTITASRIRSLERLERDAYDAERRRLRMGPEETRADVALQLQTAGVNCNVRDAKRVGLSDSGGGSIYEAVCDGGPGYMLVNGVDPSATSCLVLAGAAANTLRRNPEARVGAQCTLPENQNGRQLVGNWAREAGVACKVDQAEWLGSTDAGFDMYEIGCEGSEGFWLEKAASGWLLRGCLQVNAEGLNCRFTDQAEQRAWLRTRLAGTPAQACDIAEIRVVGVSAQGSHFETRCSTPGEGYMLRIARDGPAEDVKPCAELAGRALTCALTTSRPQRSAS